MTSGTSKSSAWPEVELGDVCEFAYGKSLPAKARTGNGYPVFGSNGPVGFHEKALTSGATIIVGRKGSFGEVHYSPSPCSPIDTTYYITEKQTNAHIPWLARRLRCLDLNKLNRAAAIPGLNRADAYRQRLLLPPLAEQTRIAAILDAADDLRIKRRESLAQLDTLLQSTFLDMFGDPVTNPMGWEEVQLVEIAELENGDRSSNYPSGSDVVDEGILFLNTKNIVEHQLILDECQFITPNKFESLSRGKLKRNDIVITLRGTLGSCAVFDCQFETGFINAQLLIIRSKGMKALYLHGLLSSKPMNDHFSRIATGVAVKQLTGKQIGSLRIPLAPLDLQNRFAAIVDSIEQQKAKQRAHLDELDILFASLQSRAFNGEL